MLADGLAYVDPSPKEEQQRGRMTKTPSVHRDQPVAEAS